MVSPTPEFRFELAGTECWWLPQREGMALLYAPLRSYLGVLSERADTQMREVASARVDIHETDVARELLARWEEYPAITVSEIAGDPGQVGVMRDLSLALSYQCNLACVYCHANAGEASPVMPFGVARVSIDRLVEDCRRTGARLARLQFQGGGEPSRHMDMIREIVEYFTIACEREGLRHEVAMATNGVYSERVAEEIARLFSGVSLSLDGPKDIFDAHRPLRNGRSAFARVMSTARVFIDRRFPFALRATISSFTLAHQDRFFEFFETRFPGISVGLEPLNPQGRGERCAGVVAPPAERAFTEFLEEAYRRSINGGFQFRNSTLGKFNVLRTHFCMAIAQPAMTVLPDGRVVACTRDGADPIYNFGRISEDGDIQLDVVAMNNLRAMGVQAHAECAQCFCKYNCGGGCLDIRLSGQLRCGTTRALGMLMLRDKAGLQAFRMPRFLPGE